MAGLTAAQRQQYDEQGYVVFKRLLAPEALQPLIDDIGAEVDQRAREYYAKGLVKSLHAEHGFETRLAKLWAECEAIHRHWSGGRHAGPGLFSLLTHPKLLDIAESIVGPEVHCEGRHRLRPKLPHWDEVTVPWHDDTSLRGATHHLLPGASRPGHTGPALQSHGTVAGAPDDAAARAGVLAPTGRGERGERLSPAAPRWAPSRPTIRVCMGSGEGGDGA